jgi:hypothetical protein
MGGQNEYVHGWRLAFGAVLQSEAKRDVSNKIATFNNIRINKKLNVLRKAPLSSHLISSIIK